MGEQVRVVKQRPGGLFSAVKYSLAALRYLVTGFVALLLALLLVLLFVEVGAAIGAALEHAHEDIPPSSNYGGSVTGASPQTRTVFWRAGFEVGSVHPQADFGTAALLFGRDNAFSPVLRQPRGSVLNGEPAPVATGRIPLSGFMARGPQVEAKERVVGEEGNMKSQSLKTNTQNTPGTIFRPDVPEEKVQNGPTLAEIRHRAFEIHTERGGIHGCDLDDWLQAERELQEKYNQVNDGRQKKK
jgi:hypothetical protein